MSQQQWTPASEGLNRLLSLLREFQSTNHQVQQNIEQQLKSFRSFPDFNNYLVYVFSKMKNEPEYVRSVAGLVLKNNIKEYFSKTPMEVQQYIKAEVLSCLGDSMVSVRKTVGTLITTIVYGEGLQSWPELIPTLLHFLDTNDYNLLEGVFGALSFLCEDYAYKASGDASRPLDPIIPKIIPFFQSTHPMIRKHAINCMNQFITEMPNILLANMNTFLQAVFFLASDPTPAVKTKVCQAFVKLTEVRIDYLTPHLANIIEFMLAASNDVDEEVSIEALEFWYAIAESKLCKQVIAEHLPRLMPLIINRMCYSDSDSALQFEEEDEAVPDESKDIKPFHSSSRSKGHSNTHSSEGSGQAQDDDDDEDFLDDDDDQEEVSQWNVRKCAASALDSLALVFKDDLLPHILPTIQERLNSKEWRVRESAILCLGAVAEGCMRGMNSHLPNLVTFLMLFLNDAHPLIRSITCWSLSRYSRWIVRHPHFEPFVVELLNRILDKNKKVQEAACSAFATLEEEAGRSLVRFLNPILRCFVTAFAKYQAKNLLILYDAIGILADSVGSELNNPAHTNILMPPLINRWNTLADDDRGLLPLLECLTSISSATGVGFQAYALPVFQRCLKLIENCILQEAMHSQNQADPPEKEFQVCALDLISGMIEGLGTGVESLVSSHNLVHLLYQSCRDQRADVRQSAFAMLGDLSKSCIVHLKPHLHEFLPVLIGNFDNYNLMPVCNNACWATGEIALRIGDDMKPYLGTALTKLVGLITNLQSKANKYAGLLENAAITIGRLGIACPDSIAPHLEEFIQPWCSILREMRDDAEKDSAFRGLCSLIKANPNGVVKHFVYVCDAIGSWERPQQDLKDTFLSILHGFKNSMGQQNWPAYYASFPDQLRLILDEQYRL